MNKCPRCGKEKEANYSGFCQDCDAEHEDKNRAFMSALDRKW